MFHFKPLSIGEQHEKKNIIFLARTSLSILGSIDLYYTNATNRVYCHEIRVLTFVLEILTNHHHV